MSGDKSQGFGGDTNGREIPVPELPYRPRNPKSFKAKIGLVGCGGITKSHLAAYRKAGFEVVALCDRDRKKAEERQKDFYPQARICASSEELVALQEVNVVDAATHPDDRITIIEQALDGGKHVLSQKPFCLDLEVGERLVQMATEKGLCLAVNQNGRWAPHWSYLREAVRVGLVGKLNGLHCETDWDHNWVVGTPFDSIHHLLLYDFAIHWFDICTVLHGYQRAKFVYANLSRSLSQRARPPLMGKVVIEYAEGGAALAFNGNTLFGGSDSTTLVGDKATLRCCGPNLNEHTVTYTAEAGTGTFAPRGSWDPDGFHGTMGELLCAIEEEREPSNAARTNLLSLELAFAAIASANSGQPVEPGSVRSLQDAEKYSH